MATIQTRVSKKTNKKSYTARIRVKDHDESKSFSRLTDAKAWMLERELEVKRGNVFSQDESKTVKNLVDKYIEEFFPTIKSPDKQIVALNWLLKELGSKKLVNVSKISINKLKEKMLKHESRGKKLSLSTINRYFSYIKRVFNLAHKEWNWISESPVSHISKYKEPRGRVRFLSEEEKTSLLTECKKNNTCLYPVVLIALCTGARKNEIMTLTWSNINFEREVITLEDTKNGERRSIPISKEIMKIIKKLPSYGKSGYIFPGATGNPFDIRRAWTKAIKDAKIKNFKFHDLRHTAASYMVMSNVNLILLAEILGHKSLEMVKRYSHFSHTHKIDAISTLSKRVFED